MKRILASLLFSLFAIGSFAQTGDGAIRVLVTDGSTGDPLSFVNVVAKLDGVTIHGAATDMDGIAVLQPIRPDTYLVEIYSIGYQTLRIDSVVVLPLKPTLVPSAACRMTPAAEQLTEVVVVEHRMPLFQSAMNVPKMVGHAIRRSPMRGQGMNRMPMNDGTGLAATAGVTASKDDNMADLSSNIARSTANFFYIEGVKVRGSSAIPQSAIDRIELIEGGLPARYENYDEATAFFYGLPPKESSVGLFSKKKKEEPKDFEPDPRYVFDKLLEDYEYYAENEFKSTQEEGLSTFSIDVDKGSYTNARRIINSGYLPPLASIRLEEFVNYFPYERVERDDEHPFIVDSELGDCPWNEKHQLLKVTLQGDEVAMEEVPASNLVFLLDVSGSMSDPDKLPLIQRAFHLLADQVRDEDKVSIVVYAGSSGIVLDGVSGKDRRKIHDAIDRMSAGGSTAGGAGIKLAYEVAEKHFKNKGNNRVILATDGDFNVGVSDDDALVKLIEKKRESGVFLTTIGCGGGNFKDAKLEKLADHGNGSYFYIDSYQEARKVFLKELSGTLFVVAKDVKFQIEFNPSKVSSYRLLGYENRILADKDFDDDTKDAGELGAGQMVTAFYELVPPGTYVPDSNKVDKRYKKVVLTDASDSDELMNLKIRYKLPDEKESILIEKPVVLNASAPEALSEAFRFGSSVVEVGLILKDSQFKGQSNLPQAIERAETALDFDPEGYRREFITLAEMCGEMVAVAVAE